MHNRKWLYLIIIFITTVCVSCTIVRFRLFQEEKKYAAVGEWGIGVPMVMALTGQSDKSLWNHHWYWTQIPIRYREDDYFRMPQKGIIDGDIRIDSILITLYSINETYSLKLDTYDGGKPIINYLQQYDHSPVCFTFDTLTISPAEDSIRVDFTVMIRDPEDSSITETPFSYVLHRYDKKKLGIWGGK